MRLALLLLFALSASVHAQGRVWPERKNFFVVGHGLGTGLGGVISGTTVLQTFRASAVVTIRQGHGLDLGAFRFQTIFPPGGRVNDYEYANPEGDALILSYASLQRSRARGIPSVVTLGAGVVRRNTSEAGRTRDMWIARAGLDLDPFYRWSHLDATVGFNTFFTPANANNLVYIASLGLYFRIG